MRLPWRRPAAAAPGPKTRRRGRALRIALGVTAAIAVACVAFDGDWCRPLLKHYIESHSGRRFDCARLQVRFDGGLDPTITLQDVRIENAPWAAAKTPFLQARRVSATVSWRSLWEPLTVVPLVVLEDAQVDMERQADGLRNWRLGHPDDRGPARVRVLALEARNSRLHLVHRGIGLALDAASTPLPAAQSLATHLELPLVQRLRFEGVFKNHPFNADVQASERLFFGATPQFARFFALRGAARFGGWRLEASGVADDVHAPGDLDLDIRLASDTALAHSPWPLPDALGPLRPLSVQGHANRTGDTWRGTGMRVALGQRTRLEGDATFVGSWRDGRQRRRAQATVRDAVIAVDDLWALRGKASTSGQRPAEEHAWSTRPLDFSALRDFDGELSLQHARLVGGEREFAQSLHGHASLAGGRLQLDDLDLGLAGGHVTGALRVDATEQPAALSLDTRWRGLRLDQLSSTLAGNGGLAGAIDGQATIQTHGDSTRALVANAGGHASVRLAAGATVSKRLDAKLGLDGGAWLRALLDKSGRVPVACGELGLAVAHGVAGSTRLVFETADTALAGHASADLAQQTLDLRVTPVRQRHALLALDKSIHVEGSWHGPEVSLAAPEDGAPLRCATPAAR